jgi:hypothetical protein
MISDEKSYNVQECDATGDEKSINSWVHKK